MRIKKVKSQAALFVGFMFIFHFAGCLDLERAYAPEVEDTQSSNADAGTSDSSIDSGVYHGTDMDNQLDPQSDGGTAMEVMCEAGSTSKCYESPEGDFLDGLRVKLDGIGRCRAGQKRCTDSSIWGPCEGAIGPLPRNCSSEEDLNCDAMPDNTIDETCQCIPEVSKRSCTGANGCAGEQRCGADFRWLTTCEAPATCDCEPTQEESCSGGLNNCPGGMKVCKDDRTWGPCEGAPVYCECVASDQRNCSAIDGVFPCGIAKCVDGRWDTSTCSAPSQWCQDKDDDGFCAPNASCVSSCSAPDSTSKEHCDMTDCDDTQSDINPGAPEDCTSATGCVRQVIAYSSTASGCKCSATKTPIREGLTCAEYSVCKSGDCACNSGAECNIGCQAGSIRCSVSIAPACVLTTTARAGTACGDDGNGLCNDSGECYDNCIMGLPKCSGGSCVGGSQSFSCLQGSICAITYSSSGTVCEIDGHCTGTSGACVH